MPLALRDKPESGNQGWPYILILKFSFACWDSNCQISLATKKFSVLFVHFTSCIIIFHFLWLLFMRWFKSFCHKFPLHSKFKTEGTTVSRHGVEINKADCLTNRHTRAALWGFFCCHGLEMADEALHRHTKL